MQLSLFRGVHDTQPRPVTLEELVTMMRTDQSVRDLTEKHRYASPNPSQGGELAESAMSESPLLGRGRGEASFTELTDDHVNSLYCRFCLSTGLTTRPKEFNTIIESDFYPTYNPLHEYLERLPAWDGVTDHIDRLASMVHVTGCTQDMHNRFFKKWIVATRLG